MTRPQSSESARQNANLTFKLNRHYGRHGWLRLTPAYSVKLVSEILTASDRGIRVLDPFSGTATTSLCAAYAGEMDWSTTGGTWGIATSRLAEWQRSQSEFYPAYLDQILWKIRGTDKKSGALLSNYVAKYFEDMWQHIKDISKVIAVGGTVHYIVGNSRFYDIVVPVERLFAEMLTAAGFRDARIIRIRKRNSKKELYEFDVSARK